MVKDKHWIEHAHLKRGAFTGYAKKNHETIGQAIKKGEHSTNPKTKRRAFLAAVLKGLKSK